MNEDEPKKQPAFQVGQDITELSVDELHDLVAVLRDEISRLETAATERAKSLSAADALFRR
ncbi:MAG: DUF1192 domain-containing protein [Ahrensia sp.]